MKSLSTFFVSVALAAGFFIFANFASAETVIWHAPEEHIAVSAVWHTGEIHVISGGSSFYIDLGATLTVEPGVIIKVGYNGIIRPYGNFVASGTPDNMIRIVSLRDDSVGGDTNGDGSATYPAQDDWRGIQPDGIRYNSIVNVDLNYVTIKHGGRGLPRGMVIYASKVNKLRIDHCNIVDNLGGITIDYFSKNVSINNSNIYNPSYCDYSSSTDPCHWNNGVQSYSPSPMDVTNNYWGSNFGPTYTTGFEPILFNGTLLTNLMSADIAYLPFAAKPFEFGAKKRHPVILIPGILGSWPDNMSDGWVMDPILHTYDDLLDALRLAGYEDGKTLFTLPYDWMKSNVETAKLLKDKINAVKSICVASDTYDCSKVDLIGHSMGGLVARQYIESSDYQNDVDQLIFIATPHRGAPDTYIMYSGGDVDKNYYKNILYKIFIQGKAEIEGYKSHPFYDGVMYYVKEKVSSVRELLPVYDYLRDAGTGLMRHYPDNYPINAFLENLNLSDNLAKLSQVKVTNILGDDGDSTINAFRVIPPLLYEVDGKWQYGIPENYNLPFTDRGLEMGAGDSTVPKYSNSNFNGVSDTIIPNASHLSVVSKSQQAIIKELTGQEPEQTISSTIIDHLLVFQIFSPADFQVISPDGKIIGRDLDSAGLINEIINGYYTGFDDPLMPEMVIISNPMAGDYKIKLIGTENGGSYKMSVSGISGATSSESNYSGVILSDQQQEINVNYSTSSAAVSPLKPDITIESAISDVGLIYQRGLLNDNNYKKKIIRRYESISRELAKIEKFEDKKKCQKDKQIDKQREKLIEDFWDFDKYLKKLVEKGVLMQLGYDIIKSNNEYLINNL